MNIASNRVQACLLLISLFSSTLCACKSSRPYSDRVVQVGAGFTTAERLKVEQSDERPISGNDSYRMTSGIWEATSQKDRLVFPEQVSITCERYQSGEAKVRATCRELRTSLGYINDMIMIFDPEETDYKVSRWDDNVLIASSDDPDSTPTSKCHVRVLSMFFASGVTSDSSMPTHKPGCEMFKKTNTYELKRGKYYVDLSPRNDLEKPYNKQSK